LSRLFLWNLLELLATKQNNLTFKNGNWAFLFLIQKTHYEACFSMKKIITSNDIKLLSKRSQKDGSWDDRKKENSELEHLFESAINDSSISMAINHRFGNYPKRLHECAEKLWFADRADRTTGEEVLKLSKAEFCRIRHCPICQSRLSMRWVAKFHQIMPDLLKMHDKTQFLLLTLTVPNCEITELRAKIQEMNEAWKRLNNRAFFKKQILGYIRATEVTRNSKDNSAHPHFHVLLHVPNSYFNGRNYITQNEWLELWRSVMRDNSIKIVDIRKVRESKSKTREDNLISGALEVVKYATKHDNITAHKEWFLEYAMQVDRMRFMASGGTLKELMADIEREDLVNIEDEYTKEEKLTEDYGGRLCFKWDYKKHYRRDETGDFIEEIPEK